MASPETIRSLYEFLEGTYGPAKFPPATEASMMAWHMVLEPVSDEDLAEAVMAHCREESWPPAPADLMRRTSNGRSYADRAHRPFELEAGPEAPRDPKVGALLKRTRAQLADADVIDLDARRTS